MSKIDFTAILNAAQIAGREAANVAVPDPMIVIDPTTKQRWLVNDGLCGFAWVVVKPGTSSFARWLVKNKHANAAYGGGVQIWISDYNQSVARKQAHAYAMAEALSANEALSNLRIYSDSRLD